MQPFSVFGTAEGGRQGHDNGAHGEYRQLGNGAFCRVLQRDRNAILRLYTHTDEAIGQFIYLFGQLPVSE